MYLKQRRTRRARQRLRVAVCDERGCQVRAGSALGAWLARVAPARAAGSLSVALVSNARVRALNRRYRNHDYATDVLSFRADGECRAGIPEAFLGDIVIARGVARRQAAIGRHSVETEIRVLALHGLLHLLGYDHERDRGEMATMERRLQRKGGLKMGRGGRITRT